MADEQKTNPEVSGHLPWEARTLLAKAAQTPIPSGDPLARRRAIDAAEEQVRARWPGFFQPAK